jgi:hypothetical protein
MNTIVFVNCAGFSCDEKKNGVDLGWGRRRLGGRRVRGVFLDANAAENRQHIQEDIPAWALSDGHIKHKRDPFWVPLWMSWWMVDGSELSE